MPGPVVFKEAYYKTNQYAPQHITVKIADDTKLNHVGANSSSRAVLIVKDEVGNQVKGFFTENEYNNVGKLLASRFRATLEAEENEAFRPVFDGLKEYLTDPSFTADKKNSDLYQRFGFDRGERGRSRLKKYAALAKEGKAEEPTDDRKRALLEWIEENAKPKIENLDALSKEYGFWNYFIELADTSIKAHNLVNSHTHEDLHAQSLEGNINKRNNAMYDYAALLGESEMIAKSSSMTLMSDKKKIHGSFMVNAKGVELDELYRIAHNEYKTPHGNPRKLVLTGSALRDLSKLQTLDYLCGNTDRHAANMFYQYDVSAEREVKIVGVQGIDNDDSFGTVNHKGKGTVKNGRMSRIEDIMVMDSELAQEILSADSEKIENRLRLAELSADEIDAARERLSDLQKRLRSGKIKIIDSLSAWDKELESDPELEGLSSAVMGTKVGNIFSITTSVCNKYNHERSDKKDIAYPKPYAPKGTVGETTQITEGDSLSVQMQYFTEMQKTLEKLDNPDAEKVRESLSGVIDTLKDYSGKEYLSDMERNLLSEQLADLSATCDQYAQEHEKDADDPAFCKVYAEKHKMDEDDAYQSIRDETNHVRNLSAYALFSRESVRRDALEREMNAASYQAEQIQAKNKIHSTITAFSDAEDMETLNAAYADLTTELSSVDSAFIRSSQEFKDMMSAFKAVKDAGDKDAALQHLSQQAQRYLDYKVPKGQEPKLSKYAEKRVEYARKILEFSQTAAQHTESKNKEGSAAEQAQKLVQFNNRCAELVNNYIYSVHTQNEEKIKNAKDAILGAGDFFKNGCEMLQNVSQKYQKHRSIQVLCHTMLSGLPAKESSVNALARIHADLTNEANKVTSVSDKKFAKPFDSLGVSGSEISSLKEKLSGPPMVTKKTPTLQLQNKKKVPNVLMN